MCLISRFYFLFFLLLLTLTWTSGKESEDSEPEPKLSKLRRPFSVKIFKSRLERLPNLFAGSNSTKNGTLIKGGSVVSLIQGYQIGNKSVISVNKTKSFGPLKFDGIRDLMKENFENMFKRSREMLDLIGSQRLIEEGLSEDILDEKKESSQKNRKRSFIDKVKKIRDKIKKNFKSIFGLNEKEDSKDSEKSDDVRGSKDSKSKETKSKD